MLAFLKQHRRTTTHIVIIDAISRLARGLEAHIQLRTAISAAGGKLESPSIEFGEDSDSMLVENLSRFRVPAPATEKCRADQEPDASPRC
jgi:hypothetical protein